MIRLKNLDRQKKKTKSVNLFELQKYKNYTKLNDK